MAVIDFHSHILPSIDDGSKDVDMSMKMLEISSAQGVDIILATPHFYASRHRVEDFLRRRERAYDKLMQQKGDVGPSIVLGAEVAFFSGMSRADRIDELTIGGGRALLLELPFEPWSSSIVREVRTLIADRGFMVVLAHLERYMKMRDNSRLLQELLEFPLYVQINAESLLSWRGRGPLIRMYKNRQAHLLGSDCHRLDLRIPNLGPGREVLRRKLGEDILKEIDKRGNELLQLGG